MAFPFQQMPTLAEFVESATGSHGCQLHVPDFEIKGPDGSVKAHYLTREQDGETLHVVLPEIPDDERLTPVVLYSLCERLGISTGLFNIRPTDAGFEYID